MNAFCTGSNSGKTWEEVGAQTYEYKLDPKSTPNHRSDTGRNGTGYTYTGVQLNCVNTSGNVSTCNLATDVVTSVTLTENEVVDGCGT